MANNYRFDSGQLIAGTSWQTAYTVSGAYNAAAITSCIVANRTATVSGQTARVDVAVYNSSGTQVVFWANNIEIPARTSVDLIRGAQNLPPNWTVRAQGSVSGALDVTVSAIGVIYA